MRLIGAARRAAEARAAEELTTTALKLPNMECANVIKISAKTIPTI